MPALSRSFWPELAFFCDEPERMDVLASALYALAQESGLCRVPAGIGREKDLSIPQALELLKLQYALEDAASVNLCIRGPSGRELELGMTIGSNARLKGGYRAPLIVSWGEEGPLIPRNLKLLKKRDGYTDTEIATVACYATIIDLEEVVRRISGASSAIIMGACAEWEQLNVPLEGAAWFDAEGDPRRALALSWLALHESLPIWRSHTTSLDTLVRQVLDAASDTSVRLRNGDVLSREELLLALRCSKEELMEALEACVAPDAEWARAEPKAQSFLTEALQTNLPVTEIFADTPERRRVIQEHAPFHIHRLEAGALLLATHPYRTLWPLWAEALRLLDIRA